MMYLLLNWVGNIFYNPLDKPNLKPSVLANRLKTILTLFSPNNSDSYWLDKVEQTLTEAIKLCRLYNNGYVTFLELHKLVTIPNYFLDKIKVIKELFTNGILSKKDCFNAYSSIDFFQKEFFSLDSRTLCIIQSEITRITNCFVSDYEVLHTFCPQKEEINFYGFNDLIQNGKIVVLNMNIAQYQNLSKIIATYLKLDFQTEVLSRLSHSPSNFNRSVAFICDEFHEYCTTTDADFFAQSREAKCINIVATQSYSSLLHTLKDEYAVKVILQNMINKFWFRTDDSYTIEDIQKQIGKEDKIKIVKSISENASKTNFHYLTNSFISHDSTLSEAVNESIHNDFIYDSHFFTQELETFSCLSFLSDGYKILKPMKLKLIPYFVNKF
ncbi:MAG: TraM recognition domain-containing protein [Clostridia bacterium]|nr:TraM recognition domain-containing protein [Clostridia bacterium]